MLYSASEINQLTGAGGTPNVQPDKNWFEQLGEKFMAMHTNNVNNAGFGTNMRGNYNYQQMLGGDVGPMRDSLSEAAGDVAGDYLPSSSDTGGSLDPSGTDQAQWEFERQKELLAEQRAYNSAEAEKNRQWQERMSSTAYQRATEDLEKAGLNKWLAVTGGNGASASTPSGSSATSSAGDASAPNPQIYKALLQFISSMFKSALSVVDFF